MNGQLDSQKIHQMAEVIQKTPLEGGSFCFNRAKEAVVGVAIALPRKGRKGIDPWTCWHIVLDVLRPSSILQGHCGIFWELQKW